MTSHELARTLLAMPNVPVLLPYSDDIEEVKGAYLSDVPGYPAEITLN